MPRRDFPRKVKAEKLDHGNARRGRKTSEYNIWVMMRQRCMNPKDKRYASYGGRGIAICKRWDNFAAFIEDMGRRPSPSHSLERMDNDGPYSSENCVWADRIAQSNNKRNNRILLIRGERMTLTNASKQFSVPYSALKCRLRRGWSDEEAVELIPRPQAGGPRITRYAEAKYAAPRP
jgi:hypothetical protein